MRYLLMVALVLTTGIANAQMRPDQLPRMESSDPAAPALRQWQETAAANYRKGGWAVATFSPWFVLRSDSLKTLFPQYRFFVISWSENRVPGKEVLGLAAGLEKTLVCDANGRIVKEIDHSGNYEPFGELLQSANVAIRTNEDATLVWNAFCEIHQRQYQNQPAIKVDDRTWHFGNQTNGRFHYYYEVRLNADLRVEDAKLHGEPINPQQ